MRATATVKAIVERRDVYAGVVVLSVDYVYLEGMGEDHAGEIELPMSAFLGLTGGDKIASVGDTCTLSLTPL